MPMNTLLMDNGSLGRAKMISLIEQYPATAFSIFIFIVGAIAQFRFERAINRINDNLLRHERDLGRLEAGKANK